MKITSLVIGGLFFGCSLSMAAVDRYLNESTGPTAQQQSAQASDVEITRQIRRALMKNDSLSISAKNIQIITQAGEVTLKGVVSSVQEQQVVVKTAQGVAGVQGLFNQTEVKSTKE